MNEPPPDNSSSQRTWEHGWLDHERKQRERLAKLPLADKIAWLEEAQRLVRQMKPKSPRPPRR